MAHFAKIENGTVQYASLEWLSDTPKPTQKELDDAQPALLAAENKTKTAQAAARQALSTRLGITEADIELLLR